ncbi:hypothetical protein [Bradyrhizobium sp. CB3481]|uniref:hypothetical protein n=1 Tax=Bradyrhizobium sp. CB3481 TaxID=3039158 RepID=UPI0024B0D0B0|nr:hypothetical protein [Bradyrhizobium sp. CB3481]WFU17288.1 hypothetical protein QA643_02685 [Bradyrhizobium sp. CB3481]
MNRIEVFATVIARSEATKQSTPSGLRDELLRFARNDRRRREKAARAALGDGWKPRALCKEEVGEVSSSQPMSGQ